MATVTSIERIIEDVEARIRGVEQTDISCIQDINTLMHINEVLREAKVMLKENDPASVHSSGIVTRVDALAIQVEDKCHFLKSESSDGLAEASNAAVCTGREVGSEVAVPAAAAAAAVTEVAVQEEVQEEQEEQEEVAVLPDHPERMEDRVTFGNRISRTIYGEVFRGKYYTGEDVAIKLSYKDKLMGMMALEDPMGEVEIMKTISQRFGDHPNLLKFFESGEMYHQGKAAFYSITSLCSGGELFDLVEQNGYVSEDVARKYFKQMIEALEFVHGCNFCHLDISLENLLLTKEDNICLIDFGMAKEFNGEPHFNASSAAPGKIQYQSPEIHKRGIYDGVKSDIYSCGVCLFILTIGTPPYQLPSHNDPRFRYIFSGQLMFLLKHWKFDSRLSGDLVDLLQNILIPDQKRLSLEEIKSHPWMNP